MGATAYSPIRVRIDQSLDASLSDRARGRPLVIDYFASHRCGVTIGDLTVEFGSTPLAADYVELEAVDDVPIFAEQRLLPVLAAGATIGLAGPRFARHVSVSIDRPEAWLDFLDHHPGPRHSSI